MTPLREWLRDWSRWRRWMRAMGHPAQAVIDAQTGGIRYSPSVRAGFEWHLKHPLDRAPTILTLSSASPLTMRLRRLQGGACYLCAKRLILATREHVVPRALGGRNGRNILLACGRCNLRKADRAPHPCELIYRDAVYARITGSDTPPVFPPLSPSPAAPTPGG